MTVDYATSDKESFFYKAEGRVYKIDERKSFARSRVRECALSNILSDSLKN